MITRSSFSARFDITGLPLENAIEMYRDLAISLDIRSRRTTSRHQLDNRPAIRRDRRSRCRLPRNRSCSSGAQIEETLRADEGSRPAGCHRGKAAAVVATPDQYDYQLDAHRRRRPVEPIADAQPCTRIIGERQGGPCRTGTVSLELPASSPPRPRRSGSACDVSRFTELRPDRVQPDRVGRRHDRILVVAPWQGHRSPRYNGKDRFVDSFRGSCAIAGGRSMPCPSRRIDNIYPRRSPAGERSRDPSSPPGRSRRSPGVEDADDQPFRLRLDPRSAIRSQRR